MVENVLRATLFNNISEDFEEIYSSIEKRSRTLMDLFSYKIYGNSCIVEEEL